ncbi:MAG: xanthine dehydrogenase family protein molybdopterin-binding subunit, partial [Candidatus Bathyarchaeia archaeon]
GMLHGKILRSPHPHARITKIDTSEAEKLKGVRAVLTYKNVPRTISYVGHLHPPHTPLDRYILDNILRYVGDEVAAVAADTPEIAEEAVDRLHVEYERLPTVFDPEEAMKPGAPKLHDEGEYIYDRDKNVAFHLRLNVGDIGKGFKDSSIVVGPEKFSVSAAHTAPIERHGCIAHWDLMEDKVTIWTSSQAVFRFRTAIAHELGIPENRLRIVTPYIGGAFGGKLSAYPYHAIAALLSKEAGGKPVKVILSREEVFVGGTCNRHPGTLTLKLGATREGLFKAFDATVVFSTGGYAYHGSGPIGFCSAMLTSLYNFATYDVRGFNVYTNTPPSGAFRGYGNPQAQWALEQLVDMVAEECKMDPLEMRKKNHVKVGDVILWSGVEVKSCGLDECIDKGAETIGWKKRYDSSYRGTGPKRRGIGVGMMTHVSGTKYIPGEAEIASVILKVDESGTFTLLSGAHELGQGARTIAVQIAAEELGVRPSDIVMTDVDTDNLPLALGNYGSRYTYVDGTLIRQAAVDTKRQLLEWASKKFDTAIDNLEFDKGIIRVKRDGGATATIAQLVKFAHWYNPEEAGAIIGKATGPPLYNAPPFGAQFAEVEVDVETGEVKVQRLVAVHDVGRAINPMLCEGQIEGAISQGLGYALTEGLMVDSETGKILNSDLMDYKLFTAADMPRVDVALVEPIDPTGPFGAKGVGEPALVPTAPAIANAVYNAVGVRIKDMPILPEKVLNALKAKR